MHEATPVDWVTPAVAHRVTGTPPLNTYVKATEPLGFVDPEMVDFTVAVKDTASLTNEGDSDDTTAVVVAVKPTG